MKFYQTRTTHYFFYLLLLNSINCFAMELVDLSNDNERINQQVETIRDMIDIQLGVNIKSFFRPIVGSLVSYYETIFLSQQNIYNEINVIENLLKNCYATQNSPATIKKEIFLILLNRHWYVHYLVKACIQERIKEFENVTCSTLDQLLNPDFSEDIIGIKQLLHDRAQKAFINQSNINNPTKNIWHFIEYHQRNDPHCTILTTSNHKIRPHTMIMSQDEKYLKITDVNDNFIIWDTKNGTQVSPQPNIQWSSKTKTMYECPCIFNKNYFVTIMEDSKNIILLKHPTLESYLCQKLVERNQNNLEQLKTLKKSKTLNAIEGFPGKNFKQQINQAIENFPHVLVSIK